jgi:hypothetical protein
LEKVEEWTEEKTTGEFRRSCELLKFISSNFMAIAGFFRTVPASTSHSLLPNLARAIGLDGMISEAAGMRKLFMATCT